MKKCVTTNRIADPTTPPPSLNGVNDKHISLQWLWCKIVFTNEPLWFRLLVIIIIVLAATIIVLYLMRDWVLFTVAGKKTFNFDY